MSTPPSRRRPSLGRGLDALFADDDDLAPVAVSDDNADGTGDSPVTQRRGGATLPIESLVPNPYQPRTRFDEDELNGLADSIRQQGVLSPVIVREDPDEAGRYQIVAGERRWRAAQLAQLHDIPVIVRSLTDADIAQIALLENVQRQDLDAVEEGAGYRCLIDQFGYTQDGLGRMLGKSRSHIANTLRLLDLPDDVLTLLKERALSAGHARALLSHPDQVAAARVVIDEGLTVRQTEALVKEALAPVGESGGDDAQTGVPGDDVGASSPDAAALSGAALRNNGQRSKDADTLALEHDLTSALGLRVSIDGDKSGESGRLTIHYSSFDQLDDVIRRIRGGG
ncbi:ParB/RepB/Spo0J family partition protein [Fodinicurvata sp. EGI_FJ10296]|uniref:ParB/RepB/Spo0J family partition protein n=1 Tax=Fodinicurvata sp. EGI_FJ10296 TaxID=3231908 RepID=UPI0034570070